MDGQAHRVVGGLVGVAVYFGCCRLFGRQPSVSGVVVAVGTGVVGGSLHDLVEPATAPNHRAFFHSVVFNGFLAEGLRRGWLNPEIPPEQKILLAVLGIACLSHPCLDALTPKGLPLI